jgi:hypothetical protein
MKFQVDKTHEYDDSVHVEAIAEEVNRAYGTQDNVVAFQFFITKEQWTELQVQVNEWFGDSE